MLVFKVTQMEPARTDIAFITIQDGSVCCGSEADPCSNWGAYPLVDGGHYMKVAMHDSATSVGEVFTANRVGEGTLIGTFTNYTGGRNNSDLNNISQYKFVAKLQ